MSAFRNQLAADLDGVFLNEEEFAEVRVFNGTALKCVRADEEAAPSGRGRSTEVRDDGTFARESTLFLKRSDLGRTPAVGERVTLDDEKADLVNVSEAEGLLALRLQWIDS